MSRPGLRQLGPACDAPIQASWARSSDETGSVSVSENGSGSNVVSLLNPRSDTKSWADQGKTLWQGQRVDHSGLEPLDVGELQPMVPLPEERHGGAGCCVRDPLAAHRRRIG
jgi:hypothetical protein